MDIQLIEAKLKLIAALADAQAKQLGRHWDDELRQAVGQIAKEARALEHLTERR